jgi:hypothetical protein
MQARRVTCQTTAGSKKNFQGLFRDNIPLYFVEQPACLRLLGLHYGVRLREEAKRNRHAVRTVEDQMLTLVYWWDNEV